MGGSFDNLRDRWGFGRAFYAWVMSKIQSLTGLNITHLLIRRINPDVDVPALPDGYTMRFLDNRSLQAAVNNPELKLSSSFLEQTQANGDYCVGAFVNDDLVAYVWRSHTSTLVHSTLKLCFPNDMRYGYKALTMEQHRGLRLQNSISLSTERHDYEQGRTHALSFIATHNYASIISDKRRGNVVFGKLIWISNRWINWGFVSPSAARKGIRVETCSASGD